MINQLFFNILVVINILSPNVTAPRSFEAITRGQLYAFALKPAPTFDLRNLWSIDAVKGVITAKNVMTDRKYVMEWTGNQEYGYQRQQG